jgi:single-strand DNA-binding protein
MNDTYVTISGWVGTDVTLTDVSGGHRVASFRMGTTPRRFQDGDWRNGPTMWVQVKAWRRLAGHVAASVRNGDPVIVHGRLVADVWQKDDGTVVTQTVVVASSVGHDLTHGTSEFSRPGVEDQGAPDRHTGDRASDGSRDDEARPLPEAAAEPGTVGRETAA